MVRSSSERSKSFYVGCAIWIVGCWWLVSRDLSSIAFVGSILLVLWIFGLREKFEGETTPSAYSVFNNGGKAILGSLTGEQIDEQMRGGAVSYNNNKNKKNNDQSSSGPLTTVFSVSPKKLSENDKVKRRAAAAAAAERRLLEQQTEPST